MKIALCQTNGTIGDFPGNARRICDAAREARARGARVALFPELCVPGYPPLDLLHKRTFLEANDRALDAIARDAPPGIALLVGCIEPNAHRQVGAKALHNAVAHVEAGRWKIVARKCLLPTYDVFDEARYFEPWRAPAENLLTIDGVPLGITICEDIWNDKSFWNERLYPIDPVESLIAAGARAIINVSASPWSAGKEAFRLRMVRAIATRHGVPVVYVNQVGAQTGLIFDGGSMAVGAAGGAAFRPTYFEERIEVVDLDSLASPASQPERQIAGDVDEPRAAMIGRALVLGIGDYFRKMGFKNAVIGLSGGIDSSVTAAVAARALGGENVVGISMPSGYSSEHSRTDAAALAKNLGMRLETIAIGPIFEQYRRSLAPLFGDRAEDVTEENLQSRIRGALLMAYSNKMGNLVLATGNKSECSVGFCTLYGDTCGGLAVLADLWKTDVYDLAREINREREIIPSHVLEKPPSPELKPDQLTTDSLPPFSILDPILRALVEEECGPEEAAARTGASITLCRDMQRKVYRAEYKRAQIAPVLRVSRKAWVGRQYPIVQRFEE